MAGTSGLYGYRLDAGRAGVKIEGLADVNKALKNLSKDLKDGLKETHREAGRIVANAAIPLAPVRSGRLVKTIRSNPTQRQGRVAIGNGRATGGVPYAGPIHFGWPARRITPQPFVYDALDARINEVRSNYEKAVDRLIVKRGLQ
jgi:hypothetical protein